MKKTTAIVLMLVACLTGRSQAVADSAEAAVERYLQMMNVNGLPADSMVVIETTVTTFGSKDTVRILRWHVPTNKFRVEVWHGGRLESGLVSNGGTRCRKFSPSERSWSTVSAEEFSTSLGGYDFRGPLFGWRLKGTRLQWCGNTLLKGQPLQVVKVTSPGMYDRYYMFEPGSGLLTLIIENDSADERYAPLREAHIDWKTIHEYLPLGVSLVPSLESFMRDGVLTIMSSTAHFEAVDEALFNRD